MKNFKLTEEKKVVNGVTVYRIECVKDLRQMKKGDKGGFVESLNNIHDDALVCGNALRNPKQF